MEFDYQWRYPATINTLAETDPARTAAEAVAGEAAILQDMPASMGAEDFSFNPAEETRRRYLDGKWQRRGRA